jgi:hypothetical protein
MGIILKSTLSKMSGMVDSYIKHWKKGWYILFTLSIALFMAGFIGYSASLIGTWLFNEKINSDWIALGLLTLSPAYLGYCHAGLKDLFNSIK